MTQSGTTSETTPENTLANTGSPSLPDSEDIRQILRQVQDPEVGADIVSLGLIYAIEVTPEQIGIRLTMTSPACPMGEMILDDIQVKLKKGLADLPDTPPIELHLVWEPPWHPSMMDAATRLQFGWSDES